MGKQKKQLPAVQKATPIKIAEPVSQISDSTALVGAVGTVAQKLISPIPDEASLEEKKATMEHNRYILTILVVGACAIAAICKGR